MSRPTSYGRPGTRVIPDGWEATHAAVVATTYACTVTIGPAGTAAAWNPQRRQTETVAAAPVYTGPADIGPASLVGIGRQVDSVEEVLDVQSLEVKIPHGVAAAIAVDHLVHVDTSPNPALTGARLTVTGIDRTDRGFSRVIYAALND